MGERPLGFAWARSEVVLAVLQDQLVGVELEQFRAAAKAQAAVYPYRLDVGPAQTDPAGVAADRDHPAGGVGGTPLTLLQFSSAFCAPCRTTRALCVDVAAKVDGVRHIEVDAESHLDAVRALDVWRTPTVLMIDAEG